MPSVFDPIVEIIHSLSMDSWKERNQDALAALFGDRYPKRAEKFVALRAPDMKGEGVPYAAYIESTNPDSGPYGGMSFVMFPVKEHPCLIGMLIGTQGLAPDENILGRPGHARKLQAIRAWLNQKTHDGRLASWAKQDPTRNDIPLPGSVSAAWPEYEQVYRRYGNEMYALYAPDGDRARTTQALTAMLDLMFEERGFLPLKDHEKDAHAIRSEWFAHLMPQTTAAQASELLQQRRYVILQGPPGTGKTRMARQLIDSSPYFGRGRSVQFHPNTTYENFIGGLAPASANHGEDPLGFRFAPKPGFLMEAAAEAAKDPSKPYLLHIDEINRADLGKVLGEAIYLVEPAPESKREIHLPYDFGAPFHQTLSLPDNLHIIGTMNSADRSIAIVDVAIRRRFAFLPLWPSSDAIAQHGSALGLNAFQKLLSIFVEHASGEALSLVPGHSYFLGKDEAHVRSNLRTNLAPLLDEYLAQGYVSGFAEPIRAYTQWLESL
ncbi:MAG: AAA family ATPase [Bryobacteraceae bacterium]